jgi:hypothetical protein
MVTQCREEALFGVHAGRGMAWVKASLDIGPRGTRRTEVGGFGSFCAQYCGHAWISRWMPWGQNVLEANNLICSSGSMDGSSWMVQWVDDMMQVPHVMGRYYRTTYQTNHPVDIDWPLHSHCRVGCKLLSLSSFDKRRARCGAVAGGRPGCDAMPRRTVLIADAVFLATWLGTVNSRIIHYPRICVW